MGEGTFHLVAGAMRKFDSQMEKDVDDVPGVNHHRLPHLRGTTAWFDPQGKEEEVTNLSQHWAPTDSSTPTW